MPVNGNIYLHSQYWRNSFAVYTNACDGSEVELDCFTQKGYLYSLVAGETYKIRVFRTVSETAGLYRDFWIQAFEEQAHDTCIGAENIVLTTTNQNFTFDLRGTLPHNELGCSGGAINDYNDLWYSFTIPTLTDVLIDGFNNRNNFALYDACGGTELACINQSGTFMALSPGVYYLRVYRLSTNINYLWYLDFDIKMNSVTYVPDDNFEQALIDLGYDSLMDDYVLTSSIDTETVLFISGESIADLTGIEDFAALMSLDVSNNQLLSVDFSQNTALTSLNCSNNQLSGLTIKNGNNTAIADADFISINNPNLFCIEVDNAGWSTTNWTNVDLHSNFNTICSSIWISSTWVYGVPSLSKDAIIAENYNTLIDGNLEIRNITINIGQVLLVEDNGYVKIQNNCINNGDFTIENKGAFVQVNSFATTTGSGVYSVKKETTPYSEYDYTYFSSPTSSATIEDALVSSGGSDADYIWTLNTALFNDADDDTFDDEGDDWEHASGLMLPAKGYAAIGAGADFPFDPDNIDPPTTQHVVFNGSFNNGNIDIDVILDNDLADNFTNENLIGNPYPSAIDLELLHANNSAVLGSNFYFWTHNTGVAFGGGGTESYNFTNDDYASYTIGTGGVVAASGGVAPDQYVDSCQGFLAQATTNGTVSFTNSIRVLDKNDSFLSPFDSVIEDDRIWLNLLGEDNGDFRQILVGFFDDATDDFDEHYDGPRMPNGDNTDFYSVVSDDTRHFAIQGLHRFNVDKVIPLGLEIVEAGNYHIEIDHLEGVFNTGQDVFIYDAYTSTLHNFEEGSYSFYTEISEGVEDRLSVMFIDVTLGNIDQELNPISIYPNPSDAVFNIFWNVGKQIDIQVLDSLGRVIVIHNVIDSSQLRYELDLSSYARGVYFVKLSIDGSQSIKKIILD